MAKRGTYVYNYSLKQGYLLSLRTVIKKLITTIDSLKDLPPRHSKVIEFKDHFVRLVRVYNTLKDDVSGRLNLRVGDVSSLRCLRSDIYPELATFKSDLRNASILAATSSAGITPSPAGQVTSQEEAANMDYKWDPNDSD